MRNVLRLSRPSCIWLAVLLVSGCASVDFDYPKPESTALQSTDDTFLGQQLSELDDKHPDESGFYLLEDGIDALAVRILIAERAERTLDAQYYLITNDDIGYAFIGALLRAADRGVRVRLLLDDIQTKGYDAGMAALDSHPNFEVRIFNPFGVRGVRALNFTDLGRVNRRMHNKSMTADNQITIIGGRNIAAEYFAAHVDVNFGDVDVVGIGPIVRDVSNMFDTYWNHRQAAPVPAFAKMPDDPAAALEYVRGNIEKAMQRLRETPYADVFRESYSDAIEQDLDTFTWSTYELAYDSPDKADKKKAKTADSIVTSLDKAVQSAKWELIVVSPYFVPLKSGIKYLAALEARGVDVIIVTNSLAATNHSVVHSGYAPYRKALLESGVELREVRPDAFITGVDRIERAGHGGAGASLATLHTKAFIVDRERFFLGSFNWDPRSMDINTELGVIMDSPELAKSAVGRLMNSYDAMTYEVVLNDKGKIRWVDRSGDAEVILDKEPQTGFWRRFSVGFYQILPIKGQL